jgi:cysteine dioxygenase
MKTTFNNTAFASPILNKESYFLATGKQRLTSDKEEEGLVSPQIAYQMSTGQIPDLWKVCHDLANTFHTDEAPYSAMQFIPALRGLQSLDDKQIKGFLKNRETRHVLASNDHFELVLIHWKPGKVSDIHGHPGGGCVFKLLHGKLEEVRYSTGKSPRLQSTNSLRTGSMTYIDDSIAFHQVGNPYGSSAISLHAYIK